MLLPAQTWSCCCWAKAAPARRWLPGRSTTAAGARARWCPANCAEFAESVIEAELFGARRGAYTGAAADRPGLFQAAHRGTLFLDEVAELPLGLQAKLLRVVEQKQVRPLGGHQVTDVDVRLVAATNRDLEAEVQRGSFRHDLYQRLNGAEIHLLPLRQRKEDIPLLVAHLIRQHGGRRAPCPSVMMTERLLLHEWPGNVRELDRVLREALVRATAEDSHALLPVHLRQSVRHVAQHDAGSEYWKQRQLEMTQAKGNVSRAAAAMGISRAQVYKLLAARGLTADHFR